MSSTSQFSLLFPYPGEDAILDLAQQDSLEFCSDTARSVLEEAGFSLENYHSSKGAAVEDVIWLIARHIGKESAHSSRMERDGEAFLQAAKNFSDHTQRLVLEVEESGKVGGVLRDPKKIRIRNRLKLYRRGGLQGIAVSYVETLEQDLYSQLLQEENQAMDSLSSAEGPEVEKEIQDLWKQVDGDGVFSESSDNAVRLEGLRKLAKIESLNRIAEGLVLKGAKEKAVETIRSRRGLSSEYAAELVFEGASKASKTPEWHKDSSHVHTHDMRNAGFLSRSSILVKVIAHLQEVRGKGKKKAKTV